MRGLTLEQYGGCMQKLQSQRFSEKSQWSEYIFQRASDEIGIFEIV